MEKWGLQKLVSFVIFYVCATRTFHDVLVVVERRVLLAERGEQRGEQRGGVRLQRGARQHAARDQLLYSARAVRAHHASPADVINLWGNSYFSLDGFVAVLQVNISKGG